MDNYITGSLIKSIRENRKMTQAELAEKLGVSSKAVSKWETAKGLPDITLIEPLSKVLGVSVTELISGDAVISCCGIVLPPLEAEQTDENHLITIEKVEDEHFITVHHDMTKDHFISFVAYLTTDMLQFVKLYPEGNAQTRLKLRGKGDLYIYCNKHGLMKK